jgi:hypothetical protein
MFWIITGRVPVADWSIRRVGERAAAWLREFEDGIHYNVCPRNTAEPDQKANAGEPGKPAPTERKKLLDEVNGHIEDIYKELDVQMKRMSQIQRQVDELRENVRRLSE